MAEALRRPQTFPQLAPDNPSHHDDELAARIRSLEAERLRPVPPPPGRGARDHRPSTEPVHEGLGDDDTGAAPLPLRATRPADPGLRALRAAGQKHRQITELQEKGGRL